MGPLQQLIRPGPRAALSTSPGAATVFMERRPAGPRTAASFSIQMTRGVTAQACASCWLGRSTQKAGERIRRRFVRTMPVRITINYQGAESVRDFDTDKLMIGRPDRSETTGLDL